MDSIAASLAPGSPRPGSTQHRLGQDLLSSGWGTCPLLCSPGEKVGGEKEEQVGLSASLKEAMWLSSGPLLDWDVTCSPKDTMLRLVHN